MKNPSAPEVLFLLYTSFFTVVWAIFMAFGGDWASRMFMVTSHNWWGVVTGAFVHAGWSHAFGNVVFLWAETCLLVMLVGPVCREHARKISFLIIFASFWASVWSYVGVWIGFVLRGGGYAIGGSLIVVALEGAAAALAVRGIYDVLSKRLSHELQRRTTAVSVVSLIIIAVFWGYRAAAGQVSLAYWVIVHMPTYSLGAFFTLWGLWRLRKAGRFMPKDWRKHRRGEWV